MSSPGMEQGMKQNMVASATMQLFMRTLQAANMELAQQVHQAVATNPALEELPPPDNQESDASQTVDFEATRRHSAFIDSLTEDETLQSYLEQQIRTSGLSRELEKTCLLLIGHLDEHGRFTLAPESVVEEHHLPPALLRKALKLVQELDPAGVGAIDLQESLIIQLRRAGETGTLAMRLLQECWPDLVHHRYDVAARKIGTDLQLVQLAARRIARLNPDPGSAFAKAEQHIITPDLVVTRCGEQLELSLTGEGIPRLALSVDYRNMMAEHADKPELRQYLSRCFREGRDLIRAIDQRQKTILTVANAIVARQRAFFFHGLRAMKPLRMEDIASDTGLHVSTISRAVNGKFLRCDFGVFELRRFFSAALSSAEGQTGNSAEAVQSRIRQLIAAENPASPLSDADIAAALAEDGIVVARRTVAKYREALHILPAPLRKSI